MHWLTYPLHYAFHIVIGLVDLEDNEAAPMSIKHLFCANMAKKMIYIPKPMIKTFYLFTMCQHKIDVYWHWTHSGKRQSGLCRDQGNRILWSTLMVLHNALQTQKRWGLNTFLQGCFSKSVWVPPPLCLWGTITVDQRIWIQGQGA